MLQTLSPGARFTCLLALGLTYATVSVRPQPPGLARLLLSLPLFLLFSLGPLELRESVIVSGSVGFLLGWLANFKLLAFSAARGPLAVPGLSPLQWLLMLLLPYFPAKRGHVRPRAGSLLVSLAAKAGALAGLTMALVLPRVASYPVLVHTGYALYVWLIASLLLDGPAPLGLALLGGRMELQPAMDAPYASTSVREFWGRRYNQIVSVVLQETVFRPIMEGRWQANTASAAVLPRPPQTSADAAAANDTPAAHAAPNHANGLALQAVKPERNGALKTSDAKGAAFVDAYGAKGASAKPNGCSSSAVNGSEIPETGGDLRCRRTVAPGGSPPAHAAGAAASASAPAAAAAPQEELGHRSGGSAELIRASPRRRLVAMCAAFLVSGVMHEVCIMYMCGGRLEGSFRMLGFFALQPPIILAQDATVAALERLWRRRGRGRQTQPAAAAGGSSSRAVKRAVGVGGVAALAVRLVQTVVTLCLVLSAADRLFWGPMEACGIDQRGLREATAALGALRGWASAVGI